MRLLIVLGRQRLRTADGALGNNPLGRKTGRPDKLFELRAMISNDKRRSVDRTDQLPEGRKLGKRASSEPLDALFSGQSAIAESYLALASVTRGQIILDIQ